MSISANQRLRKAAAKAAKRKAVVAEKLARERRELTIAKPRQIDFATSPIVACVRSETVEQSGLATLAVVRKLSLGRYGTAVFLVDAWCLGVKDAYFRVVDSDAYEVFQDNLEDAGADAPIEPARARKWLRDAAAYGASNGFPPHVDFAECERIFGDIAPAEETFTFGDRGKPHYVPGPKDSFSHARHMLKRLREKFGPEEFRCTLPIPLWDGEDEDGEILEGEALEESDENPDAQAA